MPGITQEAADKLYTNQIDTGVLNLLIEHEKFGELMHLIAFYLKDINAEAIRTQNALYSTIADFLRKYGEDENADTVAAKKEPVYSADISKIQNCLNIILIKQYFCLIISLQYLIIILLNYIGGADKRASVMNIYELVCSIN